MQTFYPGETRIDSAKIFFSDLLFGPEIDIDIESSDFHGLVSVVEKWVTSIFVHEVITTSRTNSLIKAYA